MTYTEKCAIIFFMYGVYDEIIAAAEKATEKFSETEELLQYPEVQADKAYYLSVLSKYNELKNIKLKLNALKENLNSERLIYELLDEADGEEGLEIINEEIAALKRGASKLATIIADALGCKHVTERAYGRFKLSAQSSKIGEKLYSLIKEYLLSRGAKVEDETNEHANKGHLSEISFTVCGEDVITRLTPLTGSHKVYMRGGKSEELCFAVTLLSSYSEINENDLKIDVFHSHGAGGQNINKVETAVRVTHIPSGITVTCQDERSQLANRKRALETIEKRLRDTFARTEKKRIEADIYAQYKKKNSPLSFDLDNLTMTDTRLSAFNEVPFPPANFSSYIDRLISL